jgi:YesN/AraC family two-component response regulator
MRANMDLQTVMPLPENTELLDDVLRYIEGHISEKITLKDTAHYFLVSESTISKLFQAKMDISFYHCVTQRRLIAAKTLIIDGVKLDDIPNLIGYVDYSTFYRAFHKEYGISPRDFRKLQSPML